MCACQAASEDEATRKKRQAGEFLRQTGNKKFALRKNGKGTNSFFFISISAFDALQTKKNYGHDENEETGEREREVGR